MYQAIQSKFLPFYKQDYGQIGINFVLYSYLEHDPVLLLGLLHHAHVTPHPDV